MTAPGGWRRAAARLLRAQALQDQLARMHIGTRLAVTMVLALLVAALLATMGIRGLAASKESLRVVHEDRMAPVRSLSQIAQLMLANQLQLQLALTQATAAHGVVALDPAVAWQSVLQIDRNIRDINDLWAGYLAVPRGRDEMAQAQRFGRYRSRYLDEALTPALMALRGLNSLDTRRLADHARMLYEQAYPELQALVGLQFDLADAAYHEGVSRYESTRWWSLGALFAAMLLLSWLGLLLIRSIAEPLRRVIAVCERIADGELDGPIAVSGNDEISDVFRALRSMQFQLRQGAQEIHKLAYYDPLTELPNRLLLREYMRRALAEEDSADHGALLLVDLDNFKAINDTLGHEEGDKHLTQAARRLTQAVAGRGLVARLGGDEFVVLLQGLHQDQDQAQEQVRALAEQVLAALSSPSDLAGRQMRTSASLGVCLFLPGMSSAKELLKRADTAMYQAKGAGRDGFRFFDPVLQSRLEARATLETALHGAIAARQLALHYQVQVNALRQPVGVEALLRWRHPHHGQVPPSQFIPIAEASGLILALGEWVLQEACAQLRAWADQPHACRLTISVNVSARQFAHPAFVEQVQAALAASGARPDRLVLELTESTMLHDMDDIVCKMQTLRGLGVRFALDDFGTGYSCLSHLQRLPLHQLKIDRSFIQDLGPLASDAVIVRTLIAMAHSLGLHVVAEGVETEAQRAALTQLQCPAFQGYLFGMPLPVQALETWLRGQAGIVTLVHPAPAVISMSERLA